MHDIRRVQYFHTTVQDRPGQALRFLSTFGDLGINVYANTGVGSGGQYGYILYVRPEDFEAAATAVGL